MEEFITLTTLTEQLLGTDHVEVSVLYLYFFGYSSNYC